MDNKHSSNVIFVPTHISLDTAFAVWALWHYAPNFKGAKIRPESPQWDGKGMSPDDIAFNLCAGGKGITGRNAKGVGSAFKEIMDTYAPAEDMEILSPLMYYVFVENSYGTPARLFLKSFREDTRAMLEKTSIKETLLDLQGAYPNQHFKVLSLFSDMLTARLKREKKLAEAVAVLDDVTKFYKNGTIAVVTDAPNNSYTSAAFKKGARIVIYSKGNNLGVLRNDGETFRLDNAIMAYLLATKRELGYWFLHPTGQMISLGTQSAPAKRASRISTNELVDAAILVLQVHDSMKTRMF